MRALQVDLRKEVGETKLESAEQVAQVWGQANDLIFKILPGGRLEE